MKKLTFLSLLLLAINAHAQEEDSTQNLRFGSYLSIYSLQPQALETLNQQLRSAERLDVNDRILGFSLGFTQRFADQNSYLASRFSFYSITDLKDSDDHTRLRVYEFSTTGHYDLVPNQNWLVYPMLGVGLNMAEIKLITQTTATFESSISNPASEVLSQRYTTDLMLFADLGAGIERALHFPMTTLYLGISGGYRLSSSEPWSIGNLRYFTESEFSSQGWFFEIKLRSEINDSADQKESKGLFKFFQ